MFSRAHRWSPSRARGISVAFLQVASFLHPYLWAMIESITISHIVLSSSPHIMFFSYHLALNNHCCWFCFVKQYMYWTCDFQSIKCSKLTTGTTPFVVRNHSYYILLLIYTVLCNYDFCFKFSGIGTKVKTTNLFCHCYRWWLQWGWIMGCLVCVWRYGAQSYM